MGDVSNQKIEKGSSISTNKLWNKNFILFFISTLQSSLGGAISGVALSFLILKLTNSPKAMSITLALQFTPSLLTPIIATFIDRNHL